MGRLTTSLFVPRPLPEVFAFFADAGNLQRITPPWVDFRIVSPLPLEMRVGALIDYRLRVRGLPIRWQSEITAWDPPHCFVDEQRRGPYSQWIHTHRFTAATGGTNVEDDVTFRVPGGWAVERLFVRRDVAAIFEHRQRAILSAFGLEPHRPVAVRLT